MTIDQRAFIQQFALANRKLRTLFDARTRERGLSFARARLMLLLARRRDLAQSEIADELGVERPTVARMLDAMEKGGLVARATSATDRRARRVRLTRAAENEAGAVLEISTRICDEVLEGADPKDVEAAARVLRLMLHNIEKAA